MKRLLFSLSFVVFSLGSWAQPPETLLLSIAPASAAGSSFTDPSDYSPIFWYQTDTGMTVDSEHITAYADHSPNGNDLVQGGASAPHFTNAVQNGLRAIDAATGGSLVRQTLTQGTVSQPMTIYFVAAYSQVAAYEFLMDSYASANRVAVLAGTSLANKLDLYAGTDQLTTAAVGVGWHYFTVIVNGASSKIRVDGVEQMSGLNVGANALAGIRFGSSYSDANQWKSFIGDVVGYDSVHDATKLANVEGWLKSRWGL